MDWDELADNIGHVIPVITGGGSLYAYMSKENSLIRESANMAIFETVHSAVLIIALIAAVIVGEYILYVGKYNSANARKAKANKAARLAGRPETAEIEKFDKRTYIPSMIASGLVTAYAGYVVLFEVLPVKDFGFTIESAGFAAILSFATALIFCIIVDIPIHKVSDSIRDGGIVKLQELAEDVLSDPQKREKFLNDSLKCLQNLGIGFEASEVREIIDEIKDSKLYKAVSPEDIALKYTNDLLQKKAQDGKKD